jgi:glycosyltransferase involved in cell wall biosynthesis
VTFSVVIPTLGRPSLRTLLDALLAGTGPAPESIVVVDDRPLGSALELGPGVLVLRSGGRGPAAARNAGWRATSSEWVAFRDDDVLPPP